VAGQATRGPLTVAVATEGAPVAWQARCIEALAAVPGVRVQRWVTVPAQRPASRPATAGALAPVAIPEPLRTIQAEDLGSIRGQGEGPSVGVLLNLTPRVMGHLAPWAAEVWHFGYGTELARDPARVVLVDYVRGRRVTYAALVSEPGGTVLRDGWLKTAFYWRGKQLERVLLDAARWPASVAIGRTGGAGPAGAPDPAPRNGHVTARTRPDRAAGGDRVPGVMLGAAAAGRRMLTVADGLLRYSDWNVGLARAPIEQLADGSAEHEVLWLPTRRGKSAADPFGIQRGGLLHLFFEDLDLRRGRGVISHATIGPDDQVSEPECVLDLGHHVSYPFVVERDGAVFMLPETGAAGRLVLYEAVDFPRRWRPAATLVEDVPVIDASVVEYGGRWWMFGSRLDQGHNHNLFVWHAPELTGPWTPHAANPVKTDAHSARSAGTPFVAAGQLYRPSQDSSHTYGRRVIVNRVDVLTPTSFSERAVNAVEQPPGSMYPDGLHTLSAVGNRTLIDGNRVHFVAASLRHKVADRLLR
jgi:hypothetical protein